MNDIAKSIQAAPNRCTTDNLTLCSSSVMLTICLAEDKNLNFSSRKFIPLLNAFKCCIPRSSGKKKMTIKIID